MNWKAEDFMEHPEGGRFREVHRSKEEVLRNGKPLRPACTHIYFHLRADEVSRFHNVQQEEIWNLYQGALRLWIFQEDTGSLEAINLSADQQVFTAVVPAGAWQAAEPINGDALVGCTVAPGFDFEDFELITPDHACVPRLREADLGHLL
jgi:predicted cupin superfamily sugar epimerase